MQDAHMLAGAVPSGTFAVEQRRASYWRALALVALVALPFLLFWPTTQSLFVRWQDTVVRTYTHGLIVVALSVWMIWRARARWISEPVRAFPAGVIALVALTVLWLVAYRAGLQIVHQAVMPLLAWSAVATAFGPRLAYRTALPIGYLYFAVPIWDAINPLLQHMSVLAVRLMLRAVGVPAYFSGDLFHLPAGTFEIASGCSGLHFFVVGLAIAVLYGEINDDRWRTRARLIALAALLTIAMNWVRVFVVVVVGHVTDMQHYLVVEEHYSFGWVMFAGLMLLYFAIVRRWPLAPAPETAAVSERPMAVPRVGLALAIAGLLPAAAANLIDDNVAAIPAELLPAQVSGWSVTQEQPPGWRPVSKGADAEQWRTYRSVDTQVEAYAAAYEYQAQDKEVVNHSNSVLGESLDEQRRRRAVVGDWVELQAVAPSGETWLIRYAYRLHQKWYSQPLDLQLAYGVESLWSAPLSGVVAVRSACASDCDAARQALTEFTTAAWPDEGSSL